jgi:tetratricopeptide (TPR) repeat protein
MKSIFKTLLVLAVPVMMSAQNAKVQTAWRQLQDYETGKDVASLMKAKEAIDLATNHEDTKDKAKTWSYRAQIYYALFRNALEQEEKKLAATITNKDERLTKAYGNVSTVDYEEAGKAFEKLQQYDKDMTYIKTPEIMKLGFGMMGDVSNLAIGKYNVGKFLEAAEYFEASYEFTKAMGKKDTATLNNAMVSANAGKSWEKVKVYAQKIITEKVATGKTYGTLYDAQIELKDTAGAIKTLEEGNKAFPGDNYLRSRETEYLIKTGKQQQALDNLDQLIKESPNNAVLYLVKGNIYDNLANPKDAKGKDLEAPKNYDELIVKAETNYKKAVELDPKNMEALTSLGILYNNWAGNWQKRCDDLIKQATKQKECEAKSTDLFNKAIAAFEKILEKEPGNRSIMIPLRKLYMLVNQPEKAQKISEELNKKK